VLGEQLRAADDDEDEADGVRVRERYLEHRFAPLARGGERDQHGHQQRPEPDVEARREAGEREAVGRSLEFVQALPELLRENPGGGRLLARRRAGAVAHDSSNTGRASKVPLRVAQASYPRCICRCMTASREGGDV